MNAPIPLQPKPTRRLIPGRERCAASCAAPGDSPRPRSARCGNCAALRPARRRPARFRRRFRPPGNAVVEIGFGNGDALLAYAPIIRTTTASASRFTTRGRALPAGYRTADLGNVRLFRHDAVEALRTQIPPGSLQRVNLTSPTLAQETASQATPGAAAVRRAGRRRAGAGRRILHRHRLAALCGTHRRRARGNPASSR